MLAAVSNICNKTLFFSARQREAARPGIIGLTKNRFLHFAAAITTAGSRSHAGRHFENYFQRCFQQSRSCNHIGLTRSGWYLTPATTIQFSTNIVSLRARIHFNAVALLQEQFIMPWLSDAIKLNRDNNNCGYVRIAMRVLKLPLKLYFSRDNPWGLARGFIEFRSENSIE